MGARHGSVGGSQVGEVVHAGQGTRNHSARVHEVWAGAVLAAGVESQKFLDGERGSLLAVHLSEVVRRVPSTVVVVGERGHLPCRRTQQTVHHFEGKVCMCVCVCKGVVAGGEEGCYMCEIIMMEAFFLFSFF